MSDEAIEHPGPKAPKLKRRRKYPKRKPIAPAGAKHADHLAGATVAKCPTACVAGACCVTSPWLGGQFCGHPHMASHPSAPPAVFARIDELRKYIARAK